MKKLWKYRFDSRGGTLESHFIATEKELDQIIGQEIYFGEVLGKHSEVQLTFDRSDFVLVSEDIEFIDKFAQIIGSTGYNPFDFLEDSE